MSFTTDQILWYNNGVWGEIGYAVGNFGNDPASLNANIHRLVDVAGRNLQAIMQHTDADLRTPPSINTLTRIHKLVIRARSILAGRGVPPAQPNMETKHVTPAPEVFLIYPCRYFRVRNPFLKEYAGLALIALSEAMQHTENAQAFEISTGFAGLVGQYFHRIYKLMATELFGVAIEEAEALDFTLSEEQLASYDPGQFFTSTEMIDTVPRFEMIPTEDDFDVLSRGIPATDLVNLTPYPATNPYAGGKTGAAGGGGAGTTTPAFQPAPTA